MRSDLGFISSLSALGKALRSRACPLFIWSSILHSLLLPTLVARRKQVTVGSTPET